MPKDAKSTFMSIHVHHYTIYTPNTSSPAPAPLSAEPWHRMCHKKKGHTSRKLSFGISQGIQHKLHEAISDGQGFIPPHVTFRSRNIWDLGRLKANKDNKAPT